MIGSAASLDSGPLAKPFARFDRYLELERHASELTRKSYKEDFESFLAYCYDRLSRVPSIENIGIPELRGYLSYLLRM